ncbi:TPA_asm: hypothetical protein [ssRNA phage Esthiorhiza.4_13]|uniref:Uncharacterized protein n=2 Tax=Leviviricetes TaxID=2842243 RepID=A0A8S5KYC6_9VIRU|nr:hypothetical protein QIR99_gp3 [ssRNA phage Esthiorhiza.4_13]QDH91470.1 MAG: hypothetical protein H4RhizoLitter21370_000003 [Leviviridae sp.]DAD50187.1 TPA_asm: hypothetical protein [ssRNA phage Esthiorhiza.4_13]
MNWKNVINGLKTASDAITELENNGVNVDRLIGISNAQGPQAKVIQGLLSAISGLADSAQVNSLTSAKPTLKALKPKPKKKKI